VPTVATVTVLSIGMARTTGMAGSTGAARIAQSTRASRSTRVAWSAGAAGVSGTAWVARTTRSRPAWSTGTAWVARPTRSGVAAAKTASVATAEASAVATATEPTPAVATATTTTATASTAAASTQRRWYRAAHRSALAAGSGWRSGNCVCGSCSHRDRCQDGGSGHQLLVSHGGASVYFGLTQPLIGQARPYIG
jgi:hypothetical protein